MKKYSFVALLISLSLLSAIGLILVGCGTNPTGGGGGTHTPAGILYVANESPAYIAAFDRAGALNGSVTPTRKISGSKTQLDGLSYNCLFVDTAADKLYVASAGNSRILVFDNASTAEGNIAPSQTIECSDLSDAAGIFVRGTKIYVANKEADEKILVFNTSDSGPVSPTTTISYEAMGKPFDVYVTSNNTLEVAIQSLVLGSYVWPDRIYVFDNADTIDGRCVPDRTISCEALPPPNETSLWHDEASDKLFVTVRKGAGELFVFNNASAINGTVLADATTTTGFACPMSLAYDPARDFVYVLQEDIMPCTILVWNNGGTVSGIPDRTITPSPNSDYIRAIAIDPTR